MRELLEKSTTDGESEEYMEGEVDPRGVPLYIFFNQSTDQ